MANIEKIYRTSWYHNYNQRRLAKSEGLGGSRSSHEKDHRHPQSCDVTRWSLARESQIALADKDNHDIFIQLWVNPSECQWKVGTRTANEKTQGGMINFEYQKVVADSESMSRLDLPQLSINFQSGIITHGGYNHINSGLPEPSIVPHGSANFCDFLELIDQPNIMKDGTPNYVNIFYISPIFVGHRGMWLKGFFDGEISFADHAENPNMISSWSANFIIFSSNPPLNKLRSTFTSMFATNNNFKG